MTYYVTLYYNTSMNQTIYFQKDVWAEFGAEPSKSALINELLRKHYGLGRSVNIKVNNDSTISPRRVGAPSEYSTAPPAKDYGIRNMADVVAELNAAEVPTKDRSWVNEDGEVFNNSEPDFYTDLIFESRFNKVWNTQTGEEEQEVDKGMVDELKRRGQVR